MTSNSQSPFSLRPWPTGDKKPKNLTEFITCVNAEPGGFRNLNETRLRQEIQAQELGQAEDDGVDASSEDDDDGGEGEKTKTAMAAREEFLRNIDFAHQSAMLALDSVSLLLSKENPVQAGTTLSPALRDLVGIGTMGASKLKESNITEAQMQDDLAVAAGWRIIGINKMVDSVLAAAERLEKEIELETRYWADILAVSEDGWTVCALPHEPHTLGVRFGFAESAPEFRNSSIAPLIRNDDGTIKLGVGKVGGGSQRIRITIHKDGKILDQSPLPRRTPDDAPLNDRVREARNTIFHQELWYELNREARTLLASDVYYDGPTITWKQDKQTEFIFTLEDLAERDDRKVNLSTGICSSIAAYSFLQFLLFQSHRHNYNRRTSPSPPTQQGTPTYDILRAFISRLEYFRNSANLTSLLDELVLTLRHAGISTASYSAALSLHKPTASGANQTRHTSGTELHWIQQLVGNLSSMYTFTITPEARIWCQSRGIMRPIIGTYYAIFLKPLVAENQDLPQNPLEDSYPPSDPHKEPYINAEQAIYYICQATVRALSQELASRAAVELCNQDIQWSDTISGTGITDNKEKQARIDVAVVNKKLVLSLEAKWHNGKTSCSGSWTWESGNDNARGESIENIVVKLMRGGV
ncbi:subunit 17 of mediator complex-domain-containing protein [Xylariaceae sp. FL1651]|nr:subunit 17 of mediator complex-domain-containing protein [Xylariaceae sp. FL1651]